MVTKISMNRGGAIVLYLTIGLVATLYSFLIKLIPLSKEWILLGNFIALFVVGSVALAIETKGDKEKYGHEFKKVFEKYNPLLSFGSLVKALLRVSAILLLPVSISVPLSSLSIVSTTLFDYFINKESITTIDIVSIVLIVIGSIIINMDKILENNPNSNARYKYRIGIMLVLINVVLSGLLYTLYYKDVQEDSAATTMLISATVAMFLMIGIIIIGLLMGWFQKPNWKNFFIMQTGLIFILAIPYYVRYYDYKYLKEYDTIVLNAINIVFALILSVMVLKEKMTLFKTIGASIIIGGSLLGILN